MGIALFCAAALILHLSAVERYPSDVNMMTTVLSAFALIIALIAAATAIRALRHASKLKEDILLLARSVDIALKEVATHADKETAILGDMTSSVAREVEKLSGQIAAHDAATGAEPANAGKVVPHPSAKWPRPAVPAGDQSPASSQPMPAPEQGMVEAAYRRAVAAGEFDISLQAIVSVGRSAAVGFEVFASLPIEGGQRANLRRPAEPGQPEAAAFERILLNVALQAGRRRLGAASTSMPLHVAVSDAILSDSKEFGAILDMLQFYPDLAQSFILSMPGAVANSSGSHKQALDMLSAKGVRFAAEGWNETVNPADPIEFAGLTFLKISANRLLDRETARRKLAPASTIIDRAAADKVTIIAVEVANDEDAVALIDLGVDLMSGPRFGPPKRLKPEGGNRPDLFARI